MGRNMRLIHRRLSGRLARASKYPSGTPKRIIASIEIAEASSEIISASRISGCLKAEIQFARSASRNMLARGNMSSISRTLPSRPKSRNVGFTWRLMAEKHPLPDCVLSPEPVPGLHLRDVLLHQIQNAAEAGLT